jgi:DNA end-binding protein Ku
VIGNFETEGDLRQYKDDYQEELRKVIDAKIAGEEIVSPAEEETPKVVNLMEALRQSLDRVSSTKKRAAKFEPEKSRERAVTAAPRKRARG